jgi:BASS family bile acid:Na+ symporter
MVGLVIASTLVSPFTVPAVVGLLTPLLSTGYAAFWAPPGPP